MTALCGGGPSAPLSSSSTTIELTVAAIASFIVPFVGDVTAAVLAPLIIAVADVVAPVFCATDPPADPGITAAIVADALALPPTLTTFDSIKKIENWFLHQYWFQICHCTTVTTPAAAPPSNPGTVQVNTGLPKGNSQPCWNVTVPWTVPAVSGFPGNADLYAQGLPSGVPIVPTWTDSTLGVGAVHAVPINTQITNMVLSMTVNEAFVSTAGVYVMQGGTLSSNGDGTQFIFGGGGTDVQVGFLLTDPLTKTNTSANGFFDKTHPHWWSLWVGNYDSVAHSGTISLSFTCPPGVAYTTCCLADPLLDGELQKILQYVQAIYAGLPVPISSFAEATVHSGLTGNGSITFSGLPVALKVTLTTIPPWIGLDVGSPNFYFDVGFLAFATSEGSYASTRITFATEVMTVPLLSSSVGYTLDNGVIASITELVRGP
jgi:hypothetical protein